MTKLKKGNSVIAHRGTPQEERGAVEEIQGDTVVIRQLKHGKISFLPVPFKSLEHTLNTQNKVSTKLRNAASGFISGAADKK